MVKAYLSQDLPGAVGEIRILPEGVFRAVDGRPQGLPGWRMDSTIAASVIAASLGHSDILIDYEHQSLRAETNGLPAPAAGWFNRLEWREGKGMFAVGIRWNEKAKTMIAACEYRYISPVISFDPNSGDVLKIHSVAITNSPAISGLMDLSQAALSKSRAIGEGAVDPRNQRGMELLRRMNEDSRQETARLSGIVQAPEVAELTNDTNPQNQRGMELLRRMMLG